MSKKEIEILFDGRYSEQEKQGIAETLRTQFGISVSEQVIIQKAIGVPLIVILTLIGISLEAFLRSFAKEAGKILAQKLFSPAKRNKMIDLSLIHI